MRNDILSSKVNDYRDLLDTAYLSHLGLITEVKCDDGAPYRMPGFPVNARENQAKPHRAPPRCGEDTKAILAELGYSGMDLDEARRNTCHERPAYSPRLV